MKLAHRSFGPDYECLKPWPEDCFVQCGGGNTRTAFFEAFPESPQTYIRSEAPTVEEAEAKAFAALERYAACAHPEFERRDYTNGLGFCVKCGMSKSNAFLPSTLCAVCKVATYYTSDNKGLYYCEAHKDAMPEEDVPEWRKNMPTIKEMEAITAEDIGVVLTGMPNALARDKEGV